MQHFCCEYYSIFQDPEEFKIPCEFCSRLYPFSVITQHQVSPRNQWQSFPNWYLHSSLCHLTVAHLPHHAPHPVQHHVPHHVLIHYSQAGCTPTRHPPSFSDIISDDRPINPSQNSQQFGTASNVVPNRTVRSPTTIPTRPVVRQRARGTAYNAAPVGSPLDPARETPVRGGGVRGGAVRGEGVRGGGVRGGGVRGGAVRGGGRGGAGGVRGDRKPLVSSLPGAMNNLDRPRPPAETPMTVFVPTKRLNKASVSSSANDQTTNYQPDIRTLTPKASNIQPRPSRNSHNDNTENINIVAPSNEKTVNEKSFKFNKAGPSTNNKKKVLDRHNTDNGAGPSGAGFGQTFTNGRGSGVVRNGAVGGPSSRDKTFVAKPQPAKTFVVQSSKKKLVKKKDNTFVVDK